MSPDNSPASPRIAVVYFPGNNCEQESLDAIRSVGMQAELVRWNDDPKRLQDFHGYLLPGGWAYEDRVRAGAIAAKARIMEAIKEQASSGKPVIGICNGFQVLAESGLLPGLTGSKVAFALAPNHNPFISGYYCTWIRMKVTSSKKNAFSRHLDEGVALDIPVAHGEGRFISKDPSLLGRLEEKGQVLFRYCDDNGKTGAGFPFNPNGSSGDVAGILNKEGNVLGMMPHPERANYQRQVPGFQGSYAQGEQEGPGRSLFRSMRAFIEEEIL